MTKNIGDRSIIIPKLRRILWVFGQGFTQRKAQHAAAFDVFVEEHPGVVHLA
jgi:hypothetical protein